MQNMREKEAFKAGDIRGPALKRVYFSQRVGFPLFQHGLCAGFPSPADDYLDESIDLSKILTPNLPATFFWRVNGHSMKDAGIFDGDMLIVDRSLKAQHGDVVVAVVNGEISLKRLLLRDKPKLSCDNKNFPEYRYPENAEIEVWGVVTFNIHRHRR